MILRKTNKRYFTYTIINSISFLSLVWLPLVLVLFALWDLRIEIRLLIENFTFTAFTFALYKHPLAIIVLILSPKMFANNIK